MESSATAREGVMATVVLEPQNTEYKVHQALFIDVSEYFKKLLLDPGRRPKSGL